MSVNKVQTAMVAPRVLKSVQYAYPVLTFVFNNGDVATLNLLTEVFVPAPAAAAG